MIAAAQSELHSLDSLRIEKETMEKAHELAMESMRKSNKALTEKLRLRRERCRELELDLDDARQAIDSKDRESALAENLNKSEERVRELEEGLEKANREALSRDAETIRERAQAEKLRTSLERIKELEEDLAASDEASADRKAEYNDSMIAATAAFRLQLEKTVEEATAALAKDHHSVRENAERAVKAQLDKANKYYAAFTVQKDALEKAHESHESDKQALLQSHKDEMRATQESNAKLLQRANDDRQKAETTRKAELAVAKEEHAAAKRESYKDREAAEEALRRKLEESQGHATSVKAEMEALELSHADNRQALQDAHRNEKAALLKSNEATVAETSATLTEDHHSALQLVEKAAKVELDKARVNYAALTVRKMPWKRPTPCK